MHDIRAIRENPAAFDAAMARRGLSGVSSEVLEIDTARRAKIPLIQQAFRRSRGVLPRPPVEEPFDNNHLEFENSEPDIDFEATASTLHLEPASDIQE